MKGKKPIILPFNWIFCLFFFMPHPSPFFWDTSRLFIKIAGLPDQLVFVEWNPGLRLNSPNNCPVKWWAQDIGLIRCVFGSVWYEKVTNFSFNISKEKCKIVGRVLFTTLSVRFRDLSIFLLKWCFLKKILLSTQKQPPEVFFEISQNSQENSCARVSFLLIL